MRDLVGKGVQRERIAEVLELGRHGGGRHGRLLGGQREVQQLHDDKASRISHAGPKTAPERRQPDGHHQELQPSGHGGQCAATRRLAQHVAVFRRRAGNVVLAGLGAALGDLGRQHGGVGGNEGAQAAPLLADSHQVRQQPRGAGGRVSRHQAVQQGTDAQHPFAQLAQLKHQVDGDAMRVQMGVDRGRRAATGFEPFAKLLQRRLAFLAVEFRCRQIDVAQGFKVAHQAMKRAGLARRRTHTQAQLGGEAGRADLAGAKSERLQHRALPLREGGPRIVRRWRRRWRLQQYLDARQRDVVECRQPLGIKAVGQHQGEQRRGVQRFGRAGQQFQPNTFEKFVNKGTARRKPVVGQQGGAVNAVHQGLPPGTPAHFDLGAR